MRRTPGLIAIASLRIDDVLTVTVSIAAGGAALTSLFQGLAPYRVGITVVAIALIALANLRGVRESGQLCSVPTYLFLATVPSILQTLLSSTP